MMTKQQLTTQNHQALAFGLGLVFFVAVLISLVSAAWWLSQQVFGQENSPVKTIDIIGEMPYTQRQDVINAMESIDLGNFFEVNVNDIQAQVATLPWVYSVAVRKQWPDKVKIYIVDQTPVAQWNENFLLNQFGKAFQADNRRLSKPLPKFFGPEGSELVALENYSNLNSLLEYSQLSIEELVLSERFSWQLTLNDGVMLNLGREERVERIQRFMDVYPLIKAHIKQQAKTKNIRKKSLKQAVDYIDLRYDTGLAVGWREIPELSLNKQSSRWQNRQPIRPLNPQINMTNKEYSLNA